MIATTAAATIMMMVSGGKDVAGDAWVDVMKVLTVSLLVCGRSLSVENPFVLVILQWSIVKKILSSVGDDSYSSILMSKTNSVLVNHKTSLVIIVWIESTRLVWQKEATVCVY